MHDARISRFPMRRGIDLYSATIEWSKTTQLYTLCHMIQLSDHILCGHTNVGVGNPI